jgi:sugar phosphate isomerase/epimerase
MTTAVVSGRRPYPFRLATTSFIYPQDYIPNVRRLTGTVDEIELLFFESRAIPSPQTIRELAAIARESGLTYNVHLPVDVSIGHPGRLRREQDVAVLLHVLEQAAPLAPSTHTLHIPREPGTAAGSSPADWVERVHASLSGLVRAGADPARISIENLDYPLQALAEVIAGLGFRVCLDVGHLILYGQPLDAFHQCFSPAIDIIHLHGATRSREHLAADQLPPEFVGELLPIIADFRGVISLEVFSASALMASLEWLSALWNKPPGAP